MYRVAYTFLVVFASDMDAIFEVRVKALCQRIISSDIEQEAIELARQALLHERIEYLREKHLGIHVVKD